jgi:hypothetical protein
MRPCQDIKGDEDPEVREAIAASGGTSFVFSQLPDRASTLVTQFCHSSHTGN